MDNQGKKTNDNARWPLPDATASALRSRQSVRATFKLTPQSIEVISIVSIHLGIKQKSLFDHLIEDVKSLSIIANEIEDEAFSALDRIQKTFVVSRRTLTCLEQTSQLFNAPRDALVEYSIQRLMPVIAKEREKHVKRKEVLNEINEHLAQGLKILQKTKSVLGEDDPVYSRFEAAMHALQNAQSNIEHYVKKGSVIEDY